MLELVANDYLNHVFIPKINETFSYEVEEKKNDMRKNTYSKEELNLILSEKYQRKIDNASSIKYKMNIIFLLIRKQKKLKSTQVKQIA